jgi:hypothetical protein
LPALIDTAFRPAAVSKRASKARRAGEANRVAAALQDAGAEKRLTIFPQHSPARSSSGTATVPVALYFPAIATPSSLLSATGTVAVSTRSPIREGALAAL